jgi:hypothetical protein
VDFDFNIRLCRRCRAFSAEKASEEYLNEFNQRISKTETNKEN